MKKINFDLIVERIKNACLKLSSEYPKDVYDKLKNGYLNEDTDRSRKIMEFYWKMLKYQKPIKYQFVRIQVWLVHMYLLERML